MNMYSDAGTNYIRGYKGSTTRWRMGIGNADAESTGNAGSNWDLTRFNDAGTLIDTPFNINRSTGVMTAGRGAVIGGMAAATRYASFANTGALLLRYDDNASTIPLTLSNLGVNAASVGIIVDFKLSAADVVATRFFCASTEDFSVAANESAQFLIQTRQDGALATRLAIAGGAIACSSPLQANNGLAVTGAATVSTTLGVTGLITATGGISVDADLNIKRGALALTAGNGLNSNLASPGKGFVTVTGATGAYSIGGILGGTDGDVLIIFNQYNQTMTIVNEDASSTAANRIRTLTGANMVMRANLPSSIVLMYEANISRWIVVAFN
jgi:hypothetical protein